MISSNTYPIPPTFLSKYEDNLEAKKEIMDKIPTLVEDFLKTGKGTDFQSYKRYLAELCYDDLTEHAFLTRENEAIYAAKELLTKAASSRNATL